MSLDLTWGLVDRTIRQRAQSIVHSRLITHCWFVVLANGGIVAQVDGSTVGFFVGQTCIDIDGSNSTW